MCRYQAGWLYASLLPDAATTRPTKSSCASTPARCRKITGAPLRRPGGAENRLWGYRLWGACLGNEPPHALHGHARASGVERPRPRPSVPAERRCQAHAPTRTRNHRPGRLRPGIPRRPAAVRLLRDQARDPRFHRVAAGRAAARAQPDQSHHGAARGLRLPWRPSSRDCERCSVAAKVAPTASHGRPFARPNERRPHPRAVPKDRMQEVGTP
jgi:hypothetical protein